VGRNFGEMSKQAVWRFEMIPKAYNTHGMSFRTKARKQVTITRSVNLTWDAWFVRLTYYDPQSDINRAHLRFPDSIAKENGVWPNSLWASTSAPRSNKHRTESAYPLNAARCNGV
jgi:hypothetical protein